MLVPADVSLAVELAQATQPPDLGRKRTDYAAARIRHYWAFDVNSRR